MGQIPPSASVSPTPAPGSELRFEIDEGLNQNLFLQSTRQSCHALVTTSKRPRVLLTFPAGNSGVAVWMDPDVSENDGLQLQAASALQDNDGEVSFKVQANRSSLAITQCMLDSVRAIRSAGDTEPGRLRTEFTPLLHAPSNWARPQIWIQGNLITFQRKELDGHPWVLKLRVEPPTQVQWSGTLGIDDAGKLAAPLLLVNPGGEPLHFTVEGAVPFAPLTPTPLGHLLQPAVLAEMQRVDAPGSPARVRFQRAVQDLRMMSYREKYLAGCWRFETYFGRDTLISLAMLSTVLQVPAYVDGLDSVLDRLSLDGVVAHEEDIGAWAELDALRDMEGGGPGRSSWEAPYYDYKMVDGDFLLPLAEERLPAAALRAFLSGPRLVKVLRNWNRVLVQASNPLVSLTVGESVGNWRDSGSGLAGGRYPGDINTTLVPYAVLAIQKAVQSNRGLHSEMLRIARKEGFWALHSALEANDLDALMQRWLTVRRRFEVKLSVAEMRRRVGDYFNALPQDVHDALGATRLGRTTINGWLHGYRVPELDRGIRFWALCLSLEQKPVEVLNSDTCYTLFYGDPPADEVDDIVRMASLPFPVGLMTNVGMVVSNPAYSTVPTLWKALDWDAYHGVVVWGWQHNLMELGLLRQIARFSGDPHQKPLVGRMRQLLHTMLEAENRVGSMANSELWTFEVRDGAIAPLAYGVRTPSDDESNAVQLWSAAYAAVFMAHPK